MQNINVLAFPHPATAMYVPCLGRTTTMAMKAFLLVYSPLFAPSMVLVCMTEISHGLN